MPGLLLPFTSPSPEQAGRVPVEAGAISRGQDAGGTAQTQDGAGAARSGDSGADILTPETDTAARSYEHHQTTSKPEAD